MSGEAASGLFGTELSKRIASAIVLVAIAVPIILLGGLPFFLMCLALTLILNFEWFSMVRKASVSRLWYLFGIPYAAIPILCLPFIREQPSPDGLWLILLLFLVVWASDIFAYFAGRHFGGPKLMPTVSPNKTWSGAIGGLSGALLVGFVFAIYVDLSPVMAVVGSVIMSVFSQAGDLFESWFKRRFGVKDSSNLIPGHGGFLDRVDGLLTAVLPLSLYLLLTTA